ncbi:hypothetical protein [Flagellimonas crocea]|uniref:hypothetical protein n=1 Tax=Flagellimonas crocea TaxID=3067311 RepID=UPI00296FE328|nr:hypothetical protein [Muricauda sp. DH64]
MRNSSTFLLLIVFVTIIISCSKNDDSDLSITNLKSVTDCDITIQPETLVSICVDGTDSALPDEVIKFVTTFYSKTDNASTSKISWTIESGNMEILDIENSIDGLLAKSIATIKFNSDFSGNGIIKGTAKNIGGEAFATHLVELETDE